MTSGPADAASAAVSEPSRHKGPRRSWTDATRSVRIGSSACQPKGGSHAREPTLNIMFETDSSFEPGVFAATDFLCWCVLYSQSSHVELKRKQHAPQRGTANFSQEKPTSVYFSRTTCFVWVKLDWTPQLFKHRANLKVVITPLACAASEIASKCI